MPDQFAQGMAETLASPLGAVIASVGEGVAAAQRALDEAAVDLTLAIYSEGGDELLTLLRDIGYRPTFYALPDTTGEVHVSLTLSRGGSAGASPAQGSVAAARLPATRIGGVRALAPIRSYVTPVDAGFANRYNFTANASTKITFKIVPVPPPAGVEDVRIVPALAGRSVAESRTVLEAIGLEPRFLAKDGSEVAAPGDVQTIASIAPAAGAAVTVGTRIDLTID